MKKILCLLLCALVLAGCGPVSLAPPQSPAPTPTPPERGDGPTPPPCLTVALPENDEALKVLFDAYSAQQGVTVEYTQAQNEADLAVLRQKPEGEWLSFESEPLSRAVCGMLGVSADTQGLPMGQYGCGYLANRTLLAALLGEYALADLRLCTPEEWEDLCEELANWLEEPDDDTVTLNGKEYTLPKEKTELTGGLTALFVLADGEEDCYGGEVLSYALAPALDEGQPLGELTAAALAPGADALYDIFCLERESLYTPGEEPRPLEQAEAEEAFFRGKALFYRADTLRGSVLAGQGMDLALIGLKPELEEDDITAPGLAPADLYSRAVVGPYRWLAVNPQGDTDEALAFAYWLYTSHQGQRLFTDTLGLVQNGLRSPNGEPGRTLALWLEEETTLPAFAAGWADEGKAASLVEGGALLDGRHDDEYRQNMTDLFCPAE